jgi:regulator of replication initiation timing
MSNINVMDILAKNSFLKMENETLKKENEKLEKHKEIMFQDLVKYEKEIQFLKQRNKELRQKSWYEVFEENLKLMEENKNLDETCQEVIKEYAILEKEIEQYKAVLQSVEKFVGRFSNEKR